MLFRSVEKLALLLKDNRAHYIQSIGEEKVFHLERLVHTSGLSADILGNYFLGREAILIENIEAIMAHYADEKMFLQIGAFHATQTYHLLEGDGYTLAEYLNQYSETLVDKVCSIMYTYTESQVGTAGAIAPLESDYPSILKQDTDAFVFMDVSEDTPIANLYLPEIGRASCRERVYVLV